MQVLTMRFLNFLIERFKNMASKRTNYFYIGFFVLSGILLMVLALIFWGTKTLAKYDFYAETYFNESVQGLSQGSPVKYRGMQIGHVADIASVTSIYDVKNLPNTPKDELASFGSYIYVKLAMSSRFLRASSSDEFQKKMQYAIAHGLRTKLSIQGLTGEAYIDLDFQKSQTAAPLPISWEPEYAYIPSMPSTLAFFSDNAVYLLGELRKIDLPKTFKSLQNLITSTNQAVDKADNVLAASNKQVAETLINLQAITQNLKQLSESAKEHPSSLLFGAPPPPLDLNKL